MSGTTCLLWLDGIDPERLDASAAARSLAGRGADVRLAPLGLAEQSACYYQALSGMGPGKTGRYDAVRLSGYAVVPDATTPDGVWQRLLPDLLASAHRTTLFREIPANETPLIDALDADCVILHVREAQTRGDAAIDALIRQCESLVGSDGHLFVLADLVEDASATPVNVNTFLAEVGLLEIQGPLGADAEIAWGETLAYGFGAGQLRINMRGREPSGAVSPGREFDEVRDALVATLLDDWRDPRTGAGVVERVLTKSEAYSGEYLFNAPDLVVIFRPGYSASPRARRLRLDGQSIQPGEPGEPHHQPHPPTARLVAAGPALAPQATDTGSLVDLVPTLLYLLGVPVPSHVDGRVLAAIVAPEYLERTPVTVAGDDVAHLSADEQELVADRLAALGYLG